MQNNLACKNKYVRPFSMLPSLLKRIHTDMRAVPRLLYTVQKVVQKARSSIESVISVIVKTVFVLILLFDIKKSMSDKNIHQKMVFLTNESANKAEINILSARDTTRPRP